MMKNTEWGAVAYLSHSKYGKWVIQHEGINKEYTSIVVLAILVEVWELWQLWKKSSSPCLYW